MANQSAAPFTESSQTWLMCCMSILTANASGFDTVVNATSLGHGDARFDLPARLLAANALCYDLSYGRIAQPFLDWARHAGAANACDGIGMLVEQAAEAFELWHGVRPATAPVHTLLAA